MKKPAVFVLLALFAAAMIAATLFFPGGNNATVQGDAPLPENAQKQAAADFTVCDTDGNAVKLSDFAGKPAVVNFWATWCKYCVQELPDFESLYEEYKDQVSFLMVDLTDGQRETKDKALEFIKKQGYSFPVYFDSDFSAADAYSISSVPLTLFVDKDGNLYQAQIGMTGEAVLREYIEALLKQADQN